MNWEWTDLLFIVAPIFVVVFFTDNPIMERVDKWARKQ